MMTVKAKDDCHQINGGPLLADKAEPYYAVQECDATLVSYKQWLETKEIMP